MRGASAGGDLPQALDRAAAELVALNEKLLRIEPVIEPTSARAIGTELSRPPRTGWGLD